MNKTSVWRWLLGAAALIAWCLGMAAAQGAGSEAGRVLARFAGEGVSPAALTRQEAFMIEDGYKDIPGVTLWREAGNGTLTWGDGKATCDVTEVFGDIGGISGSALLSGYFPGRGEEGGCVLSGATAFALWGSTEAAGKSVTWNGKAYPVRGVVDSEDGFMLFQASAESAEAFPNMILDIPKGDGNAAASAFLDKTGFKAMGPELLDLTPLVFLMRVISFLPVIILAGSAIARLIKRGVRLFPFPALFTTYLVPGGAALWACGWLAARFGPVPAGFIPNKWSDFEFYGDLFGGLVKDIAAWLGNPGPGDLAYFGRVLGAGLLVLLAVVLLVAAISGVRADSPRAWAVSSLSSLGIMFLMTFVFHGSLALDTGMWLAPCAWLGVDLGLRAHERLLTLSAPVYQDIPAPTEAAAPHETNLYPTEEAPYAETLSQ